MSITTRNDIFTNIAAGKGFSNNYLGVGPSSSTTAAVAASGFHTVQLFFNAIGTTLPGTLVGFPLPPAPGNQILSTYGQFGNGTTRSNYLVRLYQLGTLNLAATGNQFTHDGTTFPVTRTQLGAATQALSLIPVLYVTTATTTTAAVFNVANVANTNGYVNQDGTTVVGAKTMTMPAAATAVNSAFILRLEDGDSAVRDITNVNVTVAASAGAATLFGAEILMPLHLATGGSAGVTYDALFGGLGMNDLNPAAATGGSALTSYLALMTIGDASAASNPPVIIGGVVNV